LTKEIPLQLEGVSESVYAGFWRRLAALLLDGLLITPVGLLTVYLYSYGATSYLIVFLPAQLFWFWYSVYLVKDYGGTPGKLLMEIQIIKINGANAGWKEAVLRESVMLVLSLYSGIVTAVALFNMDGDHYDSLGWLDKQVYVASIFPALSAIHMWFDKFWIWGELIVLLMNKRKRAIHDYIAGTVIVKTKYLDQIREVMNVRPPANDDPMEQTAIA
jgi:uncharacterized RDD family membrane protein YckC